MFEPVFVRRPESWREWWEGVRAFARGWYDVDLGEVRAQSPEVDEIGREAGVRLPPGVHEWACFASDLEAAGVFQAAMRDRLMLGWVEELRLFTLLTLAEGDVVWGVTEANLDVDDPPVDAWIVGGEAASQWSFSRRHADSVSMFALEQMLACLHAPGGGFSMETELSADLVDRLAQLGETRLDIGSATLIEGEDLVIRLGPSPWSAEPDVDYVQVELGPSRSGRVPGELVSLARGRGGMFHGVFAEMSRRT